VEFNKKWMGADLNALAIQRALDQIQIGGQSLPCKVATVVSSGIVTVNFEVNSGVATLPQVTVPVFMSRYVRLPIQVGDPGVCLAADAVLGGVTGLGSGAPALWDRPANLAALSFCPLGSTAWSSVDLMSTVITDATGERTLAVTPSGVEITAEATITGSLDVSGNVTVGNGASGSFTSAEGLTVVVQDGIVTNIY
jgi:hypothetical protein